MSDQTEHWYAVGFPTGKGEDKTKAVVNPVGFVSENAAWKWAREKKLRMVKCHKGSMSTLPKNPSVNDMIKFPQKKETEGASNPEERKAAVDDYVKQIMSQRSEILDAFVAKYGCQPEEAQQINYGNRWKVEKIDPAEREALRQDVMKSQAAKEMVDLIRVLLNAIYDRRNDFSEYEGEEQMRDDIDVKFGVKPEGHESLKKLRELFALDEPSKIVTL
jgi:hypothetical protein